MQVDPWALLHADVLPARAVHLVSGPFGMVAGYAGLPAVQEFSLTDILVPKEPPAAGGTVDGDHGNERIAILRYEAITFTSKIICVPC